MAFKVPERYRLEAFSKQSDGNNGAFVVPINIATGTVRAFVIASDGAGWNHVSVSFQDRCPTWFEMCKIKETFWDDPEDWAVQYHPPASRYVNSHPYCLHLWQPNHLPAFPFPPTWMVGVKNG